MPAKNKETVNQEPQEVVVQKTIPEKDLVTWNAPARPFKRRNREFYVTVFAIAALVALILFLVEGFMPVILIISLVFLFYVLNTVEPEIIEYKITNKGIKIAQKKIEWERVARFWFSRRFDNELLIVETFGLPGRLEIVIDPGVKEEIKKQASKYVIEEELPPSTLDKMANWFSKKLPQ